MKLSEPKVLWGLLSKTRSLSVFGETGAFQTLLLKGIIPEARQDEFSNSIQVNGIIKDRPKLG